MLSRGPAHNSEVADPDTPTATSSGIQLARDADLLTRSYLPPPYLESESEIFALSEVREDGQAPVHEASLPLPFCLPQLAASPKFDSAFARGYNPAFEDVGITQEMLLNFIDGLNVAIAASPPLRVVSLAGGIISFVPYHWATIAGTVIQVAAQTSMRIISKSLTDRYLRSANLDLFKPRGLSVRLCTTPAMFLLLSNSPSPSSKSAKGKLNRFGRGVGKVILNFPPIPVPIIPQVAKHIVRTMADKPPKMPALEPNQLVSPVVLRRLALMEGLALSVEMHGMPPPAKPRGVIERISAWGVKFDGKREAKSTKRIEKRRRAVERFELAGVEAGAGAEQGAGTMMMAGVDVYQDAVSELTRPSRPPNPESSTIKRIASQAVSKFKQRQWEQELQAEAAERSMRDAQRLQEQTMKANGLGTGRGLFGPLFGPRMTRMEEEVTNADLLEYWATDEVLWVVIMSTEKDADIDGIERAEDPANEERVSREEWRTEMELERGEIVDEDVSASGR